jgi:hypothetical protein
MRRFDLGNRSDAFLFVILKKQIIKSKIVETGKRLFFIIKNLENG